MTGPATTADVPRIAEDLPADTLVPGHLDAPHEPGKNLIHCASLEHALNALLTFAGGAVVPTPGSPDPGASLLTAMLRSAAAPPLLDPDSMVAVAGLYGPDLALSLRRELSHRLGDLGSTSEDGASGLRLSDAPAEADRLFVYSALARRLTFATPFVRASFPLYFRGKFVESFGLWDEIGDPPHLFARRAAQVRVHYPCFTDEEADRLSDDEIDEARHHHVIELSPTSSEDRILVAQIEPGATLRDTIDLALARVDRSPPDHPAARLSTDERVEIPVIDFDLTRVWGELRGIEIQGPSLAPERLGDVAQRVRFRLDEGGAVLVSEARGGALGLPPRHMVFEEPFLVTWLRRGAKQPILSVWIENVELLSPAEEPEILRRA